MKRNLLIIIVLTIIISIYLFYMNIQNTQVIIHSSSIQKAVSPDGGASNANVSYSLDNILSAARALSINIKIIFALLSVIMLLSVLSLIRMAKSGGIKHL